MRMTGYSREDIKEARDGLKLLKNKMDSLVKRKNTSNS
jgi:vacuolar-type H+-ATPase subunit D/Vma8